jgi:hypothetical protein
MYGYCPHYIKILIYLYALEKEYKLLSWIPRKNIILDHLVRNRCPGIFKIIKRIDIRKIDMNYICVRNERRAISFIKQHELYISWMGLSANSHKTAVNMLIKNPNKEGKHPNPYYGMSTTQNVIFDILEQAVEFKIIKGIHWDIFSGNENQRAVAFLMRNKKLIDWNHLCSNKNIRALGFLEQNPDKIDWYILSRNESDRAIDILLRNPEKIMWKAFSGNTNPRAIEHMKMNIDKIYWGALMSNEKAIDIIMRNKHRINIVELYNNTSDQALKYIKKRMWGNPSDFRALSNNTNKMALDILKRNQNRIYWEELSRNPSIFVFDEKAYDRKLKVFKRMKI